MDNMVKVICIIQARLTSSRLPNKVIMPLGSSDKSIIEHILERLSLVKGINQSVIAIPDTKGNDELADFFDKKSVEYYRGSENNVLKRYCDGIRKYNPDYVVRATSDNPLVDFENLDNLIHQALSENADYTHYSDCPIGLGIEICKASSLLYAEEHVQQDFEKEHVCPYLYLNKNIFKNIDVSFSFDFGKNIRFTVDTPEDYEFVNIIYNNIYTGRPIQNAQIKAYLDANPNLISINNKIHQKKLGE